MSTAPSPKPEAARLFAALGDRTRLTLIARLASGEPQSIARLAAGAGMTRQAVAKHLRVLERARMVRAARIGRESRYRLEPASLAQAQSYLEDVSRQWDQAIERLRALVEDA
ncbi:MAG TPA: metalloregulator ArsR/SmtB family transcription factor [Caulobacteraceae bacterium]|nr:metalloregulator ArsR/SmtB family transcription factor [Caulobacteraceae bacterium]